MTTCTWVVSRVLTGSGWLPGNTATTASKTEPANGLGDLKAARILAVSALRKIVNLYWLLLLARADPL